MNNFIFNQISESISIKKLVLDKCVKTIEDASLLMIDTIKSNRKILWCGNGGSAADAQHLSTELMGGMGNLDRKPIPSIALTTDSSFLTAWSNDNDFSSIFSRQIQGIGVENDLLIAITTSGNSENIINAIKQAKYKNMNTIVLTGIDGGRINDLADITINVPSKNTQRIQESHIMIGQILCELLENNII